MPGGGEPMHVADLSDQDGGGDRPDAVQGLDGVVAGIVFEPAGDLPFDHSQLAVVDLQQVAQRLDPQPVGTREFHGVEQFLATRPEHLRHRRQDPQLGHHRMDLRLGRGAQRSQLGPITNQLP
jgi:hypothetical protein